MWGKSSGSQASSLPTLPSHESAQSSEPYLGVDRDPIAYTLQLSEATTTTTNIPHCASYVSCTPSFHSSTQALFSQPSKHNRPLLSRRRPIHTNSNTPIPTQLGVQRSVWNVISAHALEAPVHLQLYDTLWCSLLNTRRHQWYSYQDEFLYSFPGGCPQYLAFIS